VIAALLSRCRVYVLERLTAPELETIVRRAVADPDRGLGRLGLEVEPDAVAAIVGLSRATPAPRSTSWRSPRGS
jgi:putative ATPase